MPPDTIVAISTPPGRGGIGVVRLSGPAATAVAQHLVRFATSYVAAEAHASARFAHVVDEQGATVDDAVVTTFLAPRSFTGDNIVEIAAHGSPAILDFLLDRALALTTPAQTVRLAAPGEFSQRAFLAGKLDLAQAEAIHDLIAAQTLAQARTAAAQLSGALARQLAGPKQHLLHLIAMLEAGMDFASGELDDVDTMPTARIAAAIDSVQAPLAALEAGFHAAHIARTGARIALVGRPNAGKSSLFNRLLERERAIVTAAAGTTRDTLEESFALDGIPLRLVDTAGLREELPFLEGTAPQTLQPATHPAPTEAISEAEALGIARSRDALAEADMVLVVEDASVASLAGDANMAALDARTLRLLEGRPWLHVWNKIDLLDETSRARLLGTSVATQSSSTAHAHNTSKAAAPTAPLPPLPTSALTGEGLDALRVAMLAHLRHGAADAGEAVLANRRQHAEICTALDHLRAAAASNRDTLPHEVILLDLHAALDALDALTGATSTDDVLALIFSTFCIGK